MSHGLEHDLSARIGCRRATRLRLAAFVEQAKFQIFSWTGLWARQTCIAPGVLGTASALCGAMVRLGLGSHPTFFRSLEKSNTCFFRSYIIGPNMISSDL